MFITLLRLDLFFTSNVLKIGLNKKKKDKWFARKNGKIISTQEIVSSYYWIN